MASSHAVQQRQISPFLYIYVHYGAVYCRSPCDPVQKTSHPSLAMPKLASLRRVTLLILTALFLTRSVFGHCECGYSVRDQGAKDATWIFTDIIESDFKESKDISRNSDWMRQQFNVSAKAGRGEYGKAFIPSNIGIFAPPSSGNGQRPEQSGLKLRVGSDIANGAVSGAEMDTTRQDIYHGSFRTGMKLTRTNGTCAAFFWVCLMKLARHKQQGLHGSDIRCCSVF